MRTRSVLLVMVLMSVGGWTQSNEVVKTAGFYNGRMWRMFRTTQDKVGWLIGYREGLSYGMAVSKPNAKEAIDDMNACFPKDLTYEETATALDRLYEVPENRQIAIVYALQVVSMQATGASKEKTEKALEMLRKQK